MCSFVFAWQKQLLYLSWARPSKWYKKQPLCLIRKYFGDKIALYFCWLGFYTNMLIYPAIVGTICFLYGIASINSDDNIPSKEICNETGPGAIKLCPVCDGDCQYRLLSESCFFSRITYLFDNPSTVFFAIFMSFWGKFLPMCRRLCCLLDVLRQLTVSCVKSALNIERRAQASVSVGPCFFHLPLPI